MTKDEALKLESGQRIQDDEGYVYTFVRLDDDMDLIVQNPHGLPTLPCIYREQARLLNA